MDKILNEIKRLKDEISIIEKKLNSNNTTIDKLQDDNNNHCSVMSSISKNLDELNNKKAYAKSLPKKIIKKLIFLLAFSALELLIIVFIINIILSKSWSALFLLSIMGLSCSVEIVDNFRDFLKVRKLKRKYKLEDIEEKIKENEKEFENNKKWLENQGKKDYKEMNDLRAQNIELKMEKQHKLNRINNLKNLRLNIIEDYIKDNTNVESKINNAYEEIQKKEDQKVKNFKFKSANSDK